MKFNDYIFNEIQDIELNPTANESFTDVFQKNTYDFSREMNFDPYLDFVTLKS